MSDPEKRPDIDRRIAGEARDWIVRLASGNVDDAELQRFKAWRDRSGEHRRAFERERTFWQQLQILDGTSDGVPPLRPPQPARRPAIGRRGLLIGGGAAAAAAAAVVAVPRLDVWWSADFSTGIGDQAEFALADGSVAILNTDSAIAVDFRPELRLVRLLNGEAAFRVKPDVGPLFRVAALGGNSDALGTAFAVKALDGVATVTAADGRVRVAGPAAPDDPGETQAARVELAADEQTSYAAGEPPLPATPVDTGAVLAWRSGRVIFEGRPFANAIAELGRYVTERIVLGPGVDRDVPVSAIFSTKQALAAVRALAKTQGLTARRIPGIMVLIS